MKCLLKPLAIEETMAYVQHRLAVAGADRTILSPRRPNACTTCRRAFRGRLTASATWRFE